MRTNNLADTHNKMAGPRRSTRQVRAPQRYEPDEMPDDDFSGSDDGVSDAMPDQSEEAESQGDSDSGKSDSTGSLADWIASDGEVEYQSDTMADPDWEDSEVSDFSDFGEEDSDID